MARRNLSIFDMGAATAVGGLDIAALFMQGGAAEKEQTALDIQETEAQEATTARSIQRMQRVRQVMANATAEEAARGVSIASPSFKAVQRSSFQRFNADEDADALNLSFKETQLATQRQIIREREMAGMFDTALRGGLEIGTLLL